MGTRFLIDTNILIYYFDGKFPEQIRERIHGIFQTSFHISVISKIEFLGWQKLSEEARVQARKFIENAGIYSLSENIVEETILLKRKKKIKLLNAIIAATCLLNGFCLFTRNTNDFLGIEGLKTFNPFDMENEEEE